MSLRIRVFAFAVLVCAGLLVSALGQTTGPPPLPLVPESMRGMDLFKLYCASCHGRDGRGHGPVSSELRTPPSDLTSLARQNGGVFPRARVEASLRGRDQTIAHGSDEMPVWGPIFKGLDTSDSRVKVRLANLVSYVESIQLKR